MRNRTALVLASLALALLTASASANGQPGLDDPLPQDLRGWVEDHGPLRVAYLADSDPASTGA